MYYNHATLNDILQFVCHIEWYTLCLYATLDDVLHAFKPHEMIYFMFVSAILLMDDAELDNKLDKCKPLATTEHLDIIHLPVSPLVLVALDNLQFSKTSNLFSVGVVWVCVVWVLMWYVLSECMYLCGVGINVVCVVWVYVFVWCGVCCVGVNVVHAVWVYVLMWYVLCECMCLCDMCCVRVCMFVWYVVCVRCSLNGVSCVEWIACMLCF